jgi:transcriptional regulator with XRE-family HTH domain
MFASKDYSFADRFRRMVQAIRNKEEVSDAKIARALNIRPSYLSLLMSDARNPQKPEGKILHSELVRKRAVNLEWLTGGSDELQINWQMISQLLSKDKKLGEYRVEETQEQLCRAHLEQFLDACDGDPARLGWTLIELRERFPLNKWEKASSSAISALAKPGAVVAGERLGLGPASSRKPEAGERSVRSDEPASDVDEK